MHDGIKQIAEAKRGRMADSRMLAFASVPDDSRLIDFASISTAKEIPLEHSNWFQDLTSATLPGLSS
jgi:hypothetical protein